MAINEISNCSIKGIVNILASTDEFNSDIPNFDATAFQKHTGITQRKIECSIENPIKNYFKQGIVKLIKELNWSESDIEVLICITQTPDILFPGLANRLHGELNLSPSTICFDVNLGCSGYVYGLQLIMSILNGLQSPNSKAILCVGDISTRVISKNDSSLRPLFSDAVSVTAIEKELNTKTISFFNLETYGSGSEAIKSVFEDNQNRMVMNGIDVFNYSFQFVPKNIKTLLNTFNISIDTIDFAVFHQANKMINEAIRKSIGLNENQVLYSIEKYGNTAIASIPITIVENKKMFLKENNLMLFCGFGVGFSLASCVLNFSNTIVLATFVYDEN